jgi:uncharacterized protein YggE
MKSKYLRTLASILTVSAVAGVVALAMPANGAGSADNRYITVTGVGTISVVPDAVRFSATVTETAATNASALSTASKSAAAVRAALKDKGVASKDIRSASISVYPEYSWSQDYGTRITGYRASQSFDVLVRKASDAGVVIEAVVNAGGDSVQLGGVIPTTLNPATASEEARSAAVANAKSKATSYARLLGTSVGKVLSLEEASAPVYSSPYPMAKNGVSSDQAVELDLGEQDVTVTITVRWAIN